MKLLNCLITSHSTEITELHRKLFEGHIWPFLIEPEWQFVDSLSEADVVLFSGANNMHEFFKKLKPHQIGLMLEIFHIDDMGEEDQYKQVLETYGYPDNMIIVHKNKSIENSKNFVYYDSMFNRHKLYYTEYHRIENLKDLVWTTGTTKETFNIPKNKAEPQNCKYFLSPNLIYFGAFVPRMRYRQGLQDYLNLNYKDKCFINSKETKFLSNNASNHVKIGLEQGTGGFWYPIADEYYQQSFISVYVETITTGHYKTRCITEKTFDPLIKGNFILPFAYPGIIKDIREYGFWLPQYHKFLHYAYDDLQDNDFRFSNFLVNINTVFKNYTIEKLAEFYNDNLEGVKQNRNVFFTKPYDKLYPKLLNISSGISPKIRNYVLGK